MPFARCFACFLFAFAALPLRAEALPPEIGAALLRARVPLDAVTVLVADADGKHQPRLSHRTGMPVNPASIAKLATTFAALELLGPAFTWSTPVSIEGPVRDGVLHGNLYIKGGGDPKLLTEQLWLLLRRVQGLGIRTIAGDIVLDQSAFATAAPDAAAFDGEPLRPYNAAPDALLVNFKALVLTFTPLGDRARVEVEPALASLQLPASVPLATGDCSDWRSGLKADFSDPARIGMIGAYPIACGERVWPVAYADPASFAARAIAGTWQQMGGALSGRVREGSVPAGLPVAFVWRSSSLAEVIRDVNKFSNNVMAQQIFLTLSLEQQGVGTAEGSRQILRQWWRDRIGPDLPTFSNGAGLSREERITAQQLARMLHSAWNSPLMPELVSSLPVTGVDGTMRRSRGKGVGLAHLKTGSLRDVAGAAGYVDGASGRRYVLVVIANHPRAAAVRPVIDSLIEWTADDR